MSSQSSGSRIDPRSGKADVGFGSFYNHFSTKSELVEAAAAEVLEELVELFDRLSVDVEDAATASPSQADATVRSRPQIPAVLVRQVMHYMESEGGVAPRLLRDIREGVASGRFLKAEPRLARAAVSGAVSATLQMSLTNPELVDDAACDQLVEQLLRLLGVPFDAAPRCRSRSCPNPADLRDPSAYTGPQPALRWLRPPPSSPLEVSKV